MIFHSFYLIHTERWRIVYRTTVMLTRLNRFDSKNELFSMGSWLLLLRLFCVVAAAVAMVAAT